MSRDDGITTAEFQKLAYGEDLDPTQQAELRGRLGVGAMRDILLNAPGIKGIPELSTLSYSIAVGTANDASVIDGSIVTPMNEAGAFRYLGPRATLKTDSGAVFISQSGVFSRTSSSPWACEFVFETDDETGRFEISVRGSNADVRVIVDGKALTIGSSFRPSADGASYLALVTLGAAGRYVIRLEFASTVQFRGIWATPTSNIRATKKPKYRMVVGGDSFTEPTISDNSAFRTSSFGYVQTLGYILGCDVVSCGSGGTGYVNPSTGKYKMRDRLDDMLSIDADIYVFALGINDTGYDAAEVAAEALLCVQAVRAAKPSAEIIVLSPFHARSYSNFNSNVLLTSRLIGESVTSVSGVKFVNVISPPYQVPNLPDGIIQTTVSSGSSLSSDRAFPIGSYVEIGNDVNAAVRRVGNVTGSGPYSLILSPVINRTHAAGQPIKAVGPPPNSGTGNLGAPTGTGTADIYNGLDNTHPTSRGHVNLARCIYTELSRQL